MRPVYLGVAFKNPRNETRPSQIARNNPSCVSNRLFAGHGRAGVNQFTARSVGVNGKAAAHDATRTGLAIASIFERLSRLTMRNARARSYRRILVDEEKTFPERTVRIS